MNVSMCASVCTQVVRVSCGDTHTAMIAGGGDEGREVGGAGGGGGGGVKDASVFQDAQVDNTVRIF